jgi:Calcineurin-like phosphoesterase
MIDFIGDIHGHADKLKQLLSKLGYTETNHTFSHPHSKVVFIGDYIDRGPQIKETLAIVKSMVDAGNAIALMGNHEYNAICFHYKNKQGGHLRKHTIKNLVQHYETLKQFQNNQQAYDDYIVWFKTLPLFYESEKYNAVHACWDHQHIDVLKNKLVDGILTDHLIYESTIKGTALHEAIEITLKGKEMKMPDGLFFTDKDGTQRSEIRIKWWEDPSKETYKTISIEAIENLPDSPIDAAHLPSTEFYNSENKKIFFGHYWLKGKPALQKNNICCLDYSVAKGGNLVAYRLQDELHLDEKNLIFV